MTTGKATAAKKSSKRENIELPKPSAQKKYVLECTEQDTQEDHLRMMAQFILSPTLATCRIVKTIEVKSGFWEDVDLPSLMRVIRDQAEKVNGGDMSHVEYMLMSQATALQSLFARLTEKAMGEPYMPNLEGFMKLALRAQNQCRATLETLATIKNPPVVFAKQANINQGSGNQQVNNGAAPASRAEKNINQPNELLEVQNGSETMDTRTTGATISKNPAMATVG